MSSGFKAKSLNEQLAHAWRSKQVRLGFVMTVIALVVALLGPYFAPHAPTDMVGTAYGRPNANAWLGYDLLGRDVLSRILAGGQSIVWMSISASLIAIVIGSALGVAAAYLRRKTDQFILWVTDVFIAFPDLILVLLIVSLLGREHWLIVLTVAIAFVPGVIRLSRSIALGVVTQEFIEAAEMMGYAEKYPEIVVAYLRAALEADRTIAAEPEKYSELIEKVTGIDAEVNYLFHGPLGLQTRDLTWKPEYRQALTTAIDTLKLLKKTDQGLNTDKFVNDKYIREAFKQSKLDYKAALANYAQLPLNAKDAISGKAITDTKHLAQIWVRGEPLVRNYASFKDALKTLKELETAGTDIRAIYAQASDSGIKLLANQAWFVENAQGQIDAFLLKDQAEAFAKTNAGTVRDFSSIRL